MGPMTKKHLTANQGMSILLIGLAIAYFILPDLMPFNPIDDAIVDAALLLVAAILGRKPKELTGSQSYEN